VLAAQCQQLVSLITQPRERHIHWLEMCDVCRMVVYRRSECGIVTKRLSGCHWDVGWSEGVMDAEDSGEYIEKAELSCVGGSELSTMGGVTEGKTPFKYMG